MQLTDREIRLLDDVERRRSRRRLHAWIAFVSVLAVNAADWITDFGSPEASTILVFSLVMGMGYLISLYTVVRDEDKLIELLRRYVNNDPDAIRQIAEWRTSQSTPEARAQAPRTS